MPVGVMRVSECSDSVKGILIVGEEEPGGRTTNGDYKNFGERLASADN
jgi:hypothetical protein